MSMFLFQFLVLFGLFIIICEFFSLNFKQSQAKQELEKIVDAMDDIKEFLNRTLDEMNLKER